MVPSQSLAHGSLVFHFYMVLFDMSKLDSVVPAGSTSCWYVPATMLLYDWQQKQHNHWLFLLL